MNAVMESTFVSKSATTLMVPITVSATKAMCSMTTAMPAKVSTKIIMVVYHINTHAYDVMYVQMLTSVENRLMSVIKTVKIHLVLISVVALAASF